MSRDIENQHRELIELCKSGDRKAQFELYNLYVRAMYNTSLRLVRHVEDAEDVVQEAFIKAFRKLDSFEYKSTFGAWLKRIVVNQAMDFLRQKKLDIEEVDEIEEGVQETYASPPAFKLEAVQKGIGMLADGYRQILSLYLIEGFDHEEISEIAGISVSTSKSQYHRAKKKLLQIINEESWKN